MLPVSRPEFLCASLSQDSAELYETLVLGFPLREVANPERIILELRDGIQRVADTDLIFTKNVQLSPETGDALVWDQERGKAIELLQHSGGPSACHFQTMEEEGFPEYWFHLYRATFVDGRPNSRPVCRFRYLFVEGGFFLWTYVHHAVTGLVSVDRLLRDLTNTIARPSRTTAHTLEQLREFEASFGKKANSFFTRASCELLLQKCPEYTLRPPGDAVVPRGIPMTATSPRRPLEACGFTDTGIFTYNSAYFGGEAARSLSPKAYLNAVLWCAITEARSAVPSSSRRHSGTCKLVTNVGCTTKRDFTSFEREESSLSVVTSLATEAILAAEREGVFASVAKAITEQTSKGADERFLWDRVQLLSLNNIQKLYLDVDMGDVGSVWILDCSSCAAALEWKVQDFARKKPEVIRKLLPQAPEGVVLIHPKVGQEKYVQVFLKHDALTRLRRSRVWMSMFTEIVKSDIRDKIGEDFANLQSR
ncbi:hypothetical protein B0I35DRAFT_479930 [Stachybotrys elegans]|uniref:Uncharacterized protein n=1 Tax=Stachybotrys elegans TaxID=80388 RepID=A0A8K0SU16_9HYPO|nr:hypothetical protein B0I35DRAFT_479930 [Stachybotrys elegans]